MIIKMTKRKQNKNQDEIPLWIQIVSAIYYTGAFLGVIFGLLLIFGANTMVSFLTSQNPNLIPFATEGLIIILGVLSICFGILSFFVARGLWKSQSWSKITAIMLLILVIISGFLVESLDCFGTPF
jgi:Na+-driven multidrug efflux pump